MFKNKIQEHKVLNNNLPIFNLLCLFGTVYLGLFVDYWYFLFFILVFLMFLNTKINKWQLLLCLVLCGITIPIIIFFPDYSLFNKLGILFKTDLVRQKIFDYLDGIYVKETSSFIKLILFSVKSNESYIFYKQTVDLGIVWLICVGGFHISFLSRLIYKIFKKIWKIGIWVDIVIILAYGFLLKFSYSSMRVLFMILLSPIFKKFGIKDHNKIGLIGILFCLTNTSCFNSHSFLLSFVGVSSAYFIKKLDIENKLINSLLISVLGFLSTIPFVINMNHKISLLTFINSFIFSYVFSIVFLYFLIFSWMPFMAVVHKWVIIANYAIIGNISFFNIYIKSSEWKPYIIFAYYSGLYCVKKLVYLIVYNNKI